MSILSSPLTSAESMLPSLLILTTMRSSALRDTPSPPPPPPEGFWLEDPLCGALGAASTIPISSSSACMARSTSCDCFVLLPSCIPLPFVGALGRGRSSDVPLSKSDTRDTAFLSSSRKPPPPPCPPPIPDELPDNPALARCALFWSIDTALRFASSFASLILLWRIIWWSFSSWLSISSAVLTCCRLRFSRCPMARTSSKARIKSKHCSRTPSSSSSGQNSGTSFASRRRVSRSSMMFELLFVIRSRYKDSMGW
mmetsp:Transcript_38355/g.89521  ORF Transcript_38355/g.89521 Transcript_38355/m.89521 type:complete len:255 (+) Transcript_38355:811-1575(+)